MAFHDIELQAGGHDFSLAPAAPALAPREGLYARFGKRVFDIGFSILALVMVAPILAVIAVIILFQGGPVFFAHKRVGRLGKEFACWKIRTMVPDAEARLREHLAANPVARAQWEAEFKLDNDPRVTGLGHFLRRSSLDELPQFWNVLIGDMSVVGPRPVTRAEIVRYGDNAGTVLRAKPGVTGLWQVSGRNALDYDHRVSLDVHYVKNIRWNGDLAIIVWTIREILRRSGK